MGAADTYQLQLEERNANKKSYTLETKHIIIIVIIVILSLIFVGVLSGVLSGNYARKAERQKLRNNNEGDATTNQPSLTSIVGTISPIEASSTPPLMKHPWDAIRLPKSIVPTHYSLTVQPYSNTLTFDGTQRAYFNVLQPTSLIMIHINYMIIQTVSVMKLSNGNTFDVESSFPYPKNQYYIIKLNDVMPSGEYVLTLEYKANISKALTGFYKSSYTPKDGKERVLFTTKFQPTDARKAFPCFDEPDLKATYNITVIHEPRFTARSNMPGKTSDRTDGWKETKFEMSVRMSSYLVAFVVSEFEALSNTTGLNNNIELSVWTYKDQLPTGDYSLRLGKRMMTFIERFLNVSYPMPKLDMFAIPDYGSGATEHWGIITYRQTRLLYKEGVSSIGNKEGIAGIVSHELAHLWFGNLVTCLWWNDLWVQEGMASYLEYYIIEDSEPTWKMMEQFITSEWKVGLDLDGLATSHPISMPVDHPKQIKEIFDSITYKKGASILRMIDGYLGTASFRKGLENYLKTFQYKGATSTNFWESLKTDEVDVLKVMSTWTQQMGYPVLTVDDAGSDKIKITQKHFLLDPDSKVERKSPFNYKWIVPLRFAIFDNGTWKESKVLLEDSETEISLPSNGVVLVNYGHTGFFRVNYKSSRWISLSKMLSDNHKDVTPSDRAGLIDDAFALSRAGQLDYTTSLGITKYLSAETNYVVWYAALQNWKFIDSLLVSTPFYGAFRSYVMSQLRPIVQSLGWEMKGNHLEKKQRILVLSYACSFGDPVALRQAKSIFDAWMNNNTEINPELQSLVLRYGVASGGETEWNYVYNKFLLSSNAVEKSRLRTALGRTREPWILRRWLSMSLDPNVIRSQDTVYVISSISNSNPVGKYVAWDFARANWEELIVIMSANNFHVTRLTSSITSQFTTEFELEQVNAFWKLKPNAGAGAQARLQGVEKIQSNIKWIKKYADEIGKWLNTNY